MPEFLLELGTEELPASFVEKAGKDLLLAFSQKLGEAGVLQSEGTVMGTPRRLIVTFPNLNQRQADLEKEQRGPALKAAFKEDGSPTPALQGFCRSQGVEVADLRKDEQYVWATKKVIGRDTAELLAEVVPAAIRSMNFEKSMRWGANRMRFARPIRWIVTLFDGQVVPFEIEGVASSNESKGHRFYNPDPFTVSSHDQLLTDLRDKHVEPDPNLRRMMILDGIQAIEGNPILSDDLVDENVYLTEWPTPIEGTFRAEYLVLPESVLVTAMAKHEKMFPIRGADGCLTNRYIFVRNSGEDETVRRGSEWVLNARFNDAKFFFDEDAKSSLEDFLEKTSTIVFQEKLGSVRSRAARLANLAARIAELSGADKEEAEFAREAGRLCKADLSCGLVSELSSLQGIIGGEYARREGKADAVCGAIASQYEMAAKLDFANPAGRTAGRLIIADSLDKLAGYLGLGLIPSGSSDPYGLRRAVTSLIEIAWSWPSALPSFNGMLEFALTQYEAQSVALDTNKASAALADMFAGRYISLLPNVRHDILDAAMLATEPEEVTSPRRVRFRIVCLEKLAQNAGLVQTATRPINIIISARKKQIEFAIEQPLTKLSGSALESPEGLQLLRVLSDTQEPLAKAEREEDAKSGVSLIQGLANPINKFFESTMVMADQPNVRFARLTLMHATSEALLTAGDFTKLVIEGDA